MPELSPDLFKVTREINEIAKRTKPTVESIGEHALRYYTHGEEPDLSEKEAAIQEFMSETGAENPEAVYRTEVNVHKKLVSQDSCITLHTDWHGEAALRYENTPLASFEIDCNGHLYNNKHGLELWDYSADYTVHKNGKISGYISFSRVQPEEEDMELLQPIITPFNQIPKENISEGKFHSKEHPRVDFEINSKNYGKLAEAINLASAHILSLPDRID